jgi:Fe-S cluster assembly protein SufB
VRFISAKKNEPEWMLEWRLKAYRHWLTMTPPDWAKLNVPPIDYRKPIITPRPRPSRSSAASTRSIPKSCASMKSSASRWRSRRCSPGVEGARKVAVDAVFDSRFGRHHLPQGAEEAGVIFRSISEAIREYPELVKKWLGKVVPMHDNYFACSTARCFRDGTFVYIPEGVRCPMELSTYFRINAENTGQFERTLIVADKGSYVSYLEGCTAPQRDENQLHAAVVELVALDDAEIKYSTVQNWYPGDADGQGRHLQFRHQAGAVPGRAQPR